MVRRELRNLLKNQTLDDVKPAAFKQSGGVVYPDEAASRDLQDFFEIVNSFKAVHLPTNGACPIPQTTQYATVIQEDTKQSIDLLTAGANEVLEILSIFAVTPSDYSISSAALYLQPNGDSSGNRPIVSLPNASTHTQNFNGIIYGNIIDDTGNKFHICPAPLYLNGNDTLGIATKNTPSSDLTWGIVYRNIMQ